jgi:transposase-like protein
MRRKRRQYEAELKARVALAALKGDKTINEIAGLFEVHPNLVTLWKKRALTELPRVFSEQAARGASDVEANETRLYEQIGRLKVELDWLKKKLSAGA